ncbi:MAG: VWA domain-containing protein [Planctomycetota bacterium]|jgi:Ca-activated chloride channel family protein
MPDARAVPGPFRLSYLYEKEGVSASLFAYPDPKVGGGYFLLLAGLPAELPKGATAIKRELTLVIDRSGSMRGDKIEQVREAALQIVHGLMKGEAFNIITYNDGVDLFSSAPVIKTDKTVKEAEMFINNIIPMGGTNIYDALLETLRQKPVEKMLPVVLFLTDGLPTVGRTSEVEIRELAMKSNPHNRRIFTFGVGYDVNTPLLDKISNETRAMATYVLPNEDVEVKVGQAFKKLAGPVIADTKMEVLDKDGKSAQARVVDVMPGRLPDVFEDDELVILGRYSGEEPLNFRIGGNYLGAQRSFEFSFSLDNATTRNAFVPRLWASRKIAVLIDAIRQMGGNGKPAVHNPNVQADPKMKELVDEIVKLSIEYGILTEYTAFLSLEGTNLSDVSGNKKTSMENFRRRAYGDRWGRGSMNQDRNIAGQRGQRTENRFNEYYDANMNRVSITNVQQVNDRTFFRRGNRWIDSQLVQEGDDVKPDRIIIIGSEEHRKLAEELAKDGRQGAAAMPGETVLKVKEERVMLKSK